MCSCEQGTCPGKCPCGCRHTTPPKHRADVTVDSCPSHRSGPCDACKYYAPNVGTHRGHALVEVTP